MICKRHDHLVSTNFILTLTVSWKLRCGMVAILFSFTICISTAYDVECKQTELFLDVLNILQVLTEIHCPSLCPVLL